MPNTPFAWLSRACVPYTVRILEALQGAKMVNPDLKTWEVKDHVMRGKPG